ncbi:CRYD, partial [Symbiodinium pilosum]
PLEDEATSKLSPWLAHGCLSPRLLYEEIRRYILAYQQKANSSARGTQAYTHSGIGIRNPYNVSHRIVRELLWRDFVRFGSIEAGTSIFKVGGRDKIIRRNQEVRTDPQHLASWRWSSDTGLLQAWIDGRTGFPFIDSCMRELKMTGYCKHISRLCTGWFLISDLGLDWRMGGEWFESILVDYEPTLNWFNWVYGCLEPINPHKPQSQGQQQCREILEAGVVHDPDATYIKRWIPELSSLPTILAREPWRLNPKGIQWASKSTSLRKMPFLRGFQAPPVVQQNAQPFWRRFISFFLPKVTELLGLGLPRRRRRTAHTFRYGVDYPKPVIQPVSLMHAERAEAKVRAARAISKQ